MNFYTERNRGYFLREKIAVFPAQTGIIFANLAFGKFHGLYPINLGCNGLHRSTEVCTSACISIHF